MKKLFFLALVSVLLLNCKQDTRYTQNSKEIDAVNSVIDAYNNKDWPTLMSHYADSSKTRFNKSLMASKDIPKYHKQNDANYSSRNFIKKDQVSEMITDDKGRTWVNFWGDWKCTLKANNKEYTIPIHLTARFINGKIVEDYGYWDPSEIILTLQDIEAKNNLLME